jgi:hypothetical protein
VAHHNSVLHQVLGNIPWRHFGDLVDQHKVDKGSRRMSSKTQLTAMLFRCNLRLRSRLL